MCAMTMIFMILYNRTYISEEEVYLLRTWARKRTLLTFQLNAPVVIRVKVIFALEQSVETLAKCISELKLVTD